MNTPDEVRDSSGINILWPDLDNLTFKEALDRANKGNDSANNISAIIKYSLQDGITALWMGDLETAYMEKIEPYIEWPKVDVLFAPHHGRETGRVPQTILDKLQPKVIIIGHAEVSKYLYYYPGYNIITRSSSGDIKMNCKAGRIDFYSANSNYSRDFLRYRSDHEIDDYMYYIGSMDTHKGN